MAGLLQSADFRRQRADVAGAVHDDSIDGTDRPHDLVADWIVDTEDASLAGALVVYEPDPGYPHVTGAMERWREEDDMAKRARTTGSSGKAKGSAPSPKGTAEQAPQAGSLTDVGSRGRPQGQTMHAPPPQVPASAEAQGPRTVSAVLGEIVWLMTQSAEHKSLFLSDLELRVMVPMMLQQFRIFYAPAPVPEMAAKAARESGVPIGETTNRPVGVAFWAFPSPEVEARLKAGNMRLRPEDWRSGDPARGPVWVVELIAPFGGREEMMKDLTENAIKSERLWRGTGLSD